MREFHLTSAPGFGEKVLFAPPFYQDWSTFSCLDIDRHSVSHAVTRGSGLRTISVYAVNYVPVYESLPVCAEAEKYGLCHIPFVLCGPDYALSLDNATHEVLVPPRPAAEIELGRYLTTLGAYRDAERVLVAVHATSDSTGAAGGEVKARAREAIVEVYTAWAKPDVAAAYAQQE